MEIAMSNNRPEADDGWKDGWAYSSNDCVNAHQSTAWMSPVPLPFSTPFTIGISGANTSNQTELKFFDDNGNYVDRLSLYNRTYDITPPDIKSFVFSCPIGWKKTLKIEDVTHGVVLFENGMPWTKLEK